MKAYETVYLLKWLFPETSVQQYRTAISKGKTTSYPKFKETFCNKQDSGASYWDRFEVVDDVDSENEPMESDGERDIQVRDESAD